MIVKMLKGMALAAILLTSVAEAQSLKQIGGPANPPPAGFQGQQFVDSRGCLFMKAGYGAGVNWVARVDRNRKPICTMVPTGSAAAQAAVAADMAPDPQAVAQPKVAMVTPAVPVAQQPSRQAQTTAVAVQAPVVRAPLRQVPVRQVAAPTPAPKPTVFSNSTTTQVAAAVPVRRTAPSYQTSPAATSVAGVQCYDSAPVLERVNVSGGTALVCTRGDGSASGWLPPRVANAAQARVAAQQAPLMTAPVRVTAPARGTTLQVVSVQVYAAPTYAAPAQPLVTRSHALPKPPKGWAYAWKDDRLNPLRGVGTPQGQAQQDMVWQQTIPMVLVTEAPPQTAFQHALGLQNRVPVAQVTTRASTMSAAPARKPSTQKAAPVVQVAATPAAPQASGSYLIQVGSFAQASNAQAVIARLSSLGLPVSTAKTTRKGKALQVVYAGPFSSGAEASSGLTTVHGAGYSDAFLR